jgi:hypothetical protein
MKIMKEILIIRVTRAGSILCYTILSFLLLCTACTLSAQEQTSGQSQRTPEAVHQHQLHAYRVDLVVDEMENSNKINSRRYSLNTNSDDFSVLKVGAKAPVETNGQITYLDVGTSIKCHIHEQSDGIALQLWADVSNFAVGNEQNPGDRPLIRQFHIDANTIVVPGTPIMVGTAEDPNSQREFQVKVTVTQLK